MHRIRKAITLFLSAAVFAACAVMPVMASEDPLAVKNYEEFGAAPETVVQPTVPQETQPESAAPEETVPETLPQEVPGETEESVTAATEETIPEETTAEETVPEETEPEEETNRVTSLEGMPLYFQTDYPNIRYAESDIARNGCSVSSLAMVASYMTGHNYGPVELARYFGGLGRNNIERLEIGSGKLGLPFVKADNWHRTREAIHNGKIAIVLMGQNSYFTTSQHFIVVTGVNEEGRYLVNDPYEPNYDHWKLKSGFLDGFEEADLIRGYSGAWIYDMDAMDEQPAFYYEPELNWSDSRYPDIQLTDQEKYLLASIIWVEARGESPEGQQAVAEVILNRLASGRFADTLRGVIYSEGQFRSVEFLEDARPEQAQYDAIDRAMYGEAILPGDVYHFATFRTNDNVWGTIGGHIFCYGVD